ncbi:MAG: hypothetical protein WAV16_04500 [Candidatus Moraniibacteriota bacterium]
MSLMDKIEDIRQKPEHERVRYVWGMVLLSMILIIFIWFFSLKDMLHSNKENNRNKEIYENLETLSPDGNQDNLPIKNNDNSESMNK